MDSIREKLIKEGENFINIRVVPFIRTSYPYLLSKIVIGLSGSCIYGEPDEKSDIDINILVNDSVGVNFNIYEFDNEIKNLVDRDIYTHVDISVMKLASLGINLFEIDKIPLSDNFLESGFIIDNFLPIYNPSNWFEKLKILVKDSLINSKFEEKVYKIMYYWLYSTENYIKNIKPSLERGDILTFDNFFSQSIINLIKFIYLTNNMFFPPTKWFFKNLKKASFLGDIVFNYLEIINQKESREEKAKLYEDLIEKIAEIFNKKSNLNLNKEDEPEYFEETTVSIAKYIKSKMHFLKEKNRKIRYKRVLKNGFYYLIPKVKYSNKNFIEEDIFIPYEAIHFSSYFSRFIKDGGLTIDEAYSIYRQIRILEEENLSKEIYKEYEYFKKLRDEIDEINLEPIENKRGVFFYFKRYILKNILSPSLIFSLIFIPFFYFKNNFYTNIQIFQNNKIVSFYPSKELPKVSSPNPDWYILQNQPKEALIIEYEKKDIRVYIGKREAKINEEIYTLDAPPYIKDGRTLVPLRFIAEGLGAEVSWDGVEKKVTLNYENKTIELWIGKREARINGIDYTLDVPPEITKGRTFVPIRFIAENFGSQVNWNNSLKEVSIIKEKEYKKIDENSDADKDGLTFKQEKNLGTNPNNKNTIYNSLDDKTLFELKQKYPNLNIFSPYPDGITKLTLPEKAQLNLNPTVAFNLDQKINDEIIINYALNKKPELKTREELEAIWQEFNTKYSNFIEPLKENLNLETTSKIDKAADLILKFKNLKLDEKLNTNINKEYVARVIEEIQEFETIAPIIASFNKDYINQNKNFFTEIKNTTLEFISEILTKYPELTIQKQIEINNKYPELDFSKTETFENPDKTSGLTLLEKIKYDINPLNPNNFDPILNDKKAIEYAKTKNLSDKKENIQKAIKSIIDNYGEKLGTAAKELLNEEKITPIELDNQAQTAKTQIENMWNDRAYKTKSDGTQLTLEELTSTPRYKTLMLLNKNFGLEEINILLSQSPTLQQYANENKIQEFKELINTLYQATNSTELSLNKKVKETNTFRKYVNQLGLYDYNSGELAVQMWKNADENLKKEITKHPKTFLTIVAGFGPYANAGKMIHEGKEYDFQNPEITTSITEWALKLFNYYIETEKKFKEKNVWLFKIDYKEGLEFYDFTIMQGLIPGTFANIENGGFEKILKNQGLKEALNHTLNITNELRELRNIIIEKYHKIQYKTYNIDWLDPISGPGQINAKINWKGIFSTGEKGIPYGEILKEDKKGEDLTDLEAAIKLKQLLKPENKEVMKTNHYGSIQLESIILKSIATPMIDGVYEAKKSGSWPGQSFVLVLKLEKRIQEKIKNIFGITNMEVLKHHYVDPQKWDWDQIGVGSPDVNLILPFRKDPTALDLNDKSWIKFKLLYSVWNPAGLDDEPDSKPYTSKIYNNIKLDYLVSVFGGTNIY